MDASCSFKALAWISRIGFCTSLNAGVLSVPLSPTITVQMIAGSVHPRLSWTRRVLPMAAATTDSTGRPTYDGSHRMDLDVTRMNSRIGDGSTSTGNGRHGGAGASAHSVFGARFEESSRPDAECFCTWSYACDTVVLIQSSRSPFFSAPCFRHHTRSATLISSVGMCRRTNSQTKDIAMPERLPSFRPPACPSHRRLHKPLEMARLTRADSSPV